MLNFIEKEYSIYLSSYNSFTTVIQKCDFFRYLIIYHYGGFYLDLDILILENLDNLINNEICLFCEKILTPLQCKQYNHSLKESHRVANYAFGSTPKHSFILSILKQICNKIVIPKNDNDILNSTGPGLLTRLYHIYNPCKLIYPTKPINNNYLCLCKNYTYCRVGDYGSHLHIGSWRNKFNS